jgi:predicted Zn-dependent protease
MTSMPRMMRVPPSIRKGPRGVLGAFALMLAVAGCGAVRDSDTPQSLTSLPNAAPRLVGAETPSRREHSRILASYGGAYTDQAIDRLLGDIARRVAAASDKPDIAYRVTVLNAPSINAFALPTGDLYVTRGLLALANDTSEIAAVLAHEIGHVTAGHAFLRADRERQAVLVSRVMTDVLNNPEAGAMSLARSRIALAGFSRAQELEADTIGVRTLSRAGFDPFGAPRFLRSMERNAQLKASGFATGEKETVDFLSTHPATPERVARAAAAAKEAGGSGAADRAAYLQAIEGMVYGDDPAQGFVRGARFVHPVLGLQFEAPEGFTLDNAADAVVGIGPGDSAVRLDTAEVAESRSLRDHLAADLMEGVQVTGIEDTVIAGFPAATGIAHGNQWSFRLTAIRVGRDVYRIVFAARTLTPDVDLAFRRSTASFRRLTPAEATAVRPLRLAVTQVRAGDTVGGLAQRMAATDGRRTDRFMVLNGLNAGDTLQSGQQIKLVVD